MTAPKTARPLLLVVDDEIPVLKVVERLAAKIGFDVVACASGAEAMRTLLRKPADLAMVDLRMPDVNGLDLLRQIRTMVPGCEVILMTAYAAVDSAVEAIKLGAREYLTKPFDFDRLKQVLEDIRAELERRAQVLALESQVARQLEFCGMLGRSPVMQEVFSLVQRLAPHAKVVLIGGETGTGKELAARAFHQRGDAAQQGVCHDQLLGGRRHAVRERAVRPRPRRVHRRGRVEGGRVRNGPWRHAVPGRSRRVAALASRRSCCARSNTAKCSASARCSRSGST